MIYKDDLKGWNDQAFCLITRLSSGLLRLWLVPCDHILKNRMTQVGCRWVAALLPEYTASTPGLFCIQDLNILWGEVVSLICSPTAVEGEGCLSDMLSETVFNYPCCFPHIWAVTTITANLVQWQKVEILRCSFWQGNNHCRQTTSWLAIFCGVLFRQLR